MELELELAGKITAVTFSKGGIQTQVPSVDGVPLVSTPSNRMYTAIKINNGKDSGQAKKADMQKGTSAKNLNIFHLPCNHANRCHKTGYHAYLRPDNKPEIERMADGLPPFP